MAQGRRSFTSNVLTLVLNMFFLLLIFMSFEVCDYDDPFLVKREEAIIYPEESP